MPTELQKQHQEELREKRDKLKERKSRTRRLIQHGAIAEAFVQGSEDMSPETFKAALQKLLSPIGRRIPEGPERIDSNEITKEMRPYRELVMSNTLVQCLVCEGYSQEELKEIVNFIMTHHEKMLDGKYVRLKSKIDSSKIIMIKRTVSTLEVM